MAAITSTRPGPQNKHKHTTHPPASRSLWQALAVKTHAAQKRPLQFDEDSRTPVWTQTLTFDYHPNSPPDQTNKKMKPIY